MMDDTITIKLKIVGQKEVPELEVTERHEHGLEVAYVPKGKDACVSYGSLDFKFKNNSNNKILILISSDDENVVAKLIQI